MENETRQLRYFAVGMDTEDEEDGVEVVGKGKELEGVLIERRAQQQASLDLLARNRVYYAAAPRSIFAEAFRHRIRDQEVFPLAEGRCPRPSWNGHRSSWGAH